MYSLSYFLGLEAYCIIRILQQIGSLDFHRGTCAFTSCWLCSLSPLLQRTQPLLSSYPPRFGRIKNPSCSACGHPSEDTSDLTLHYPAMDPLRARFLATLCRFTTCGPSPGELPSFWGFMVFRQASSLGRVRVETTTPSTLPNPEAQFAKRQANTAQLYTYE